MSKDEDLTEVTLSSEPVFQGRLLKVLRDNARLPGGNESTREFIVHPGAVIVIPVLSNGKLLLERQFRYPLKKVFIELPAGKIDPNEDILITGQRADHQIGHRSQRGLGNRSERRTGLLRPQRAQHLSSADSEEFASAYRAHRRRRVFHRFGPAARCLHFAEQLVDSARAQRVIICQQGNRVRCSQQQVGRKSTRCEDARQPLGSGSCVA